MHIVRKRKATPRKPSSGTKQNIQRLYRQPAVCADLYRSVCTGVLAVARLDLLENSGAAQSTRSEVEINSTCDSCRSPHRPLSPGARSCGSYARERSWEGT
eukprot:2584328-Amphidinium_carterae.1